MPLTVDYNYQTLINIPIKDRTQERYDWMRLQVSPLTALNTSFDEYYNFQENQAKYTSQVLAIEDYLNTTLNPVFPIFITDGAWLDETFLFRRGERFADKTYLYARLEAQTPIYLYNRSEFDNDQVDFFVNMSSTDAGLETIVRSTVEIFRPASKIFEILFDADPIRCNADLTVTPISFTCNNDLTII